MTKAPTNIVSFLLHMGDNCLILGHRLSEWCGHGPVLEQDIALTNIALDLVGQSRSWLQMAAEREGLGKTEDDLAYFRESNQFHNNLLVERPNGNWGNTIVRQFLFDSYHYYLLQQLNDSQDTEIQAIAQKSFKEVSYHLRYSAEWMIRLGDGTDESHQKMQDALEDAVPYMMELVTPVLFETSTVEITGIDYPHLAEAYLDKVKEIVERATLQLPVLPYYQQGGKNGKHTEHLSYILAEMQSVQRAYPGLTW